MEPILENPFAAPTEDPGAPRATPAPLTARHAALKAVTPQDYGFLYELSFSEEIGFRWRHRGATTSPEQFGQMLWQAVLAQFVIERTDNRAKIGLVAAYNPNFQHGYVYLAALLSPHYKQAAASMEALALFVNYLFTMWSFRKIYMETVEFNYAQFKSGAGKFFEVEGRLKKHEYYQGRYWDAYMLALYREAWEKHAPRVMGVVLPKAPAVEWLPPSDKYRPAGRA